MMPTFTIHCQVVTGHSNFTEVD